MPFSLLGDCNGRFPSLDALISLRFGGGVGEIFPFAEDGCCFGFAGWGFFLSGIFPPQFLKSKCKNWFSIIALKRIVKSRDISDAAVKY